MWDSPDFVLFQIFQRNHKYSDFSQNSLWKKIY